MRSTQGPRWRRERARFSPRTGSLPGCPGSTASGPRPEATAGPWKPPTKAIIASAGFRTDSRGGHEGDLGREVSPDDPRRDRGPGRGHLPPEGEREGGEPPAPPVRRACGHRQDDERDRPRAGTLRGELAGEPRRTETIRRRRGPEPPPSKQSTPPAPHP